MKQPPSMPLERVIHIAAFRASLRAFLRRTERAARHWDLTPQRYLLLLSIKGAADRSERLSFTELSRRLQLSKNTTTELVTRAEEVGLVARERSERDARVVYVRLTDEGERRLEGALLETEEDRRELVEAFAELAAAFELSLPRR